MHIKLSSLTDIEAESLKQMEKNSNDLKYPKELTIDQILQMRLLAFLTLQTTIDKLDDSNFHSDPTATKIFFRKNIDLLKKLIIQGNDYGVYLGLLELKTDVKSKIKPVAHETVNDVIDDVIESIQIQNTPVSVKPSPPQFILDSPLKQFKKGIPIDQIKCKEDLVLLMKVTGTPGCFNISSVQKIIQRGWGTEVIAKNIANTMIGQ